MSNLSDRAIIQADLAEKFWVPCPCLGLNGCLCREGTHVCSCSKEKVMGQEDWNCLTCQGSGRQYPFRAECLCLHSIGAIERGSLGHATLCSSCKSHLWNSKLPASPEQLHSRVCTVCHGFGYIYQATLDTFCAAFRDKGWDFDMRSRARDIGDEVDIRDIKRLFLGRVKYDEGLTGITAVEMAAWRTLEE